MSAELNEQDRARIQAWLDAKGRGDREYPDMWMKANYIIHTTRTANLVEGFHMFCRKSEVTRVDAKYRASKTTEILGLYGNTAEDNAPLISSKFRWQNCFHMEDTRHLELGYAQEIIHEARPPCRDKLVIVCAMCCRMYQQGCSIRISGALRLTPHQNSSRGP